MAVPRRLAAPNMLPSSSRIAYDKKLDADTAFADETIESFDPGTGTPRKMLQGKLVIQSIASINVVKNISTAGNIPL